MVDYAKYEGKWIKSRGDTKIFIVKFVGSNFDNRASKPTPMPRFLIVLLNYYVITSQPMRLTKRYIVKETKTLKHKTIKTVFRL